MRAIRGVPSPVNVKFSQLMDDIADELGLYSHVDTMNCATSKGLMQVRR